MKLLYFYVRGSFINSLGLVWIHKKFSHLTKLTRENNSMIPLAVSIPRQNGNN